MHAFYRDTYDYVVCTFISLDGTSTINCNWYSLVYLLAIILYQHFKLYHQCISELVIGNLEHMQKEKQKQRELEAAQAL